MRRRPIATLWFWLLVAAYAILCVVVENENATSTIGAAAYLIIGLVRGLTYKGESKPFVFYMLFWPFLE